jgi:hypothetical protein
VECKVMPVGRGLVYFHVLSVCIGAVLRVAFISVPLLP